MDAKEIYLKQIKDYPLLTEKDEIRLSRIIHGDFSKEEKEKAIDTLVTSNLRLVVFYVHKYCPLHMQAISFMDCVQEANKSLLRAARLYDYDKIPVRFNIYAKLGIVRRIKRAMGKNRFIKLPREHTKLSAEIEELQREYGEDLTDEMIQEELDIKESQLESVRHGQENTVVTSLDKVVDGDEFSLADLVGEDEKISQEVDNKVLREYLEKLISEFTPRTQHILREQFFEDKLQSEIGKEMGITRSAVFQTTKIAIKRLRKKILEEQNDIPETYLQYKHE